MSVNDLYVVLYQDFTALDVFGPVEVLSGIKGLRIHYVSESGGVVGNHQSIRMETERMDTVGRGNILLIPGGFGSRREVENQGFIHLLSSMIEAAHYVLCVCTGSALAAKTGTLDGRRATSNKRAFEWVRSCRPEVDWVERGRWVVDGKFYSSAGVSAGTDMALGFVRDIYGKETAEAMCERMEYHWDREISNRL